MKVNAGSLSKGNVIDHEGKLMVVLTTFISKPGKGGAYIQVDLRNVRAGTKENFRWRTEEKIEKVRLDQQDYQYLFNDGEKYTFMDVNTYEQVEISADIIGEQAVFLQDGMSVKVESYEGEALSVQLPDTVILEVMEAEPVVKGQTATSSYKPAKMDNGVRVMVPPFIDVGTKIVVRTEDSSYVERAK